MITAPQRNIVSRGHKKRSASRLVRVRATFLQILRGRLAAPRSPTSSAAFPRTLGRRKDLLIKILSAARHRSDASTPVSVAPYQFLLAPQLFHPNNSCSHPQFIYLLSEVYLVSSFLLSSALRRHPRPGAHRMLQIG